MYQKASKGEVARHQETRRHGYNLPAGATASAKPPGKQEAACSSIAGPAAGDVRSARGLPDVRDSEMEVDPDRPKQD